MKFNFLEGGTEFKSTESGSGSSDQTGSNGQGSEGDSTLKGGGKG